MKQGMSLWKTLSLSFLLAGCNMWVGLSEGRDDYLKSIKPYLQYWEKPGWTLENRRQDAEACGASGDSSDRAGIGSTRIKAARHPGETDRETETRLRQEWVHCMKEKGYQWAK